MSFTFDLIQSTVSGNIARLQDNGTSVRIGLKVGASAYTIVDMSDAEFDKFMKAASRIYFARVADQA